MSEMSMVEKVARAIADAEGWSLPNDMNLPYAPGSRIGTAMKSARAAITAMHDPTLPMLDAADSAVNAGAATSYERLQDWLDFYGKNG